MNGTKRIAQIMAGAAFFLAAFFSVFAANREYRSISVSHRWASSDFLDDGALLSGISLSLSGDQHLVDGCLQMLTSIAGRVLPSENRESLLANCDQMLAQITKYSARNSYAWFMRAFVAYERGDLAGFNFALVNSYRSGPTEQWIAELRFQLAENGYGLLLDDAKAGHLEDLALLVQSHRGIRTITSRYITEPSFRDHMINVVEDMPQDIQQRFIRVLRAEVKRATMNE